jgi:hypothetical protein
MMVDDKMRELKFRFTSQRLFALDFCAQPEIYNFEMPCSISVFNGLAKRGAVYWSGSISVRGEITWKDQCQEVGWKLTPIGKMLLEKYTSFLNNFGPRTRRGLTWEGQ